MKTVYIIHATRESPQWLKLIEFYGLKNAACYSIEDREDLKRIQVEFNEVLHIPNNGVKCL